MRSCWQKPIELTPHLHPNVSNYLCGFSIDSSTITIDLTRFLSGTPERSPQGLWLPTFCPSPREPILPLEKTTNCFPCLLWTILENLVENSWISACCSKRIIKMAAWARHGFNSPTSRVSRRGGPLAAIDGSIGGWRCPHHFDTLHSKQLETSHNHQILCTSWNYSNDSNERAITSFLQQWPTPNIASIEHFLWITVDGLGISSMLRRQLLWVYVH